MSTSQVVLEPEVLALAKKGDPAAIATLINSSLKTKGISATTFWRNGCLEILMEADPLPNQTRIMAFLRRGFESLNAESIDAVKVYARKSGKAQLAWQQQLKLKTTDSSESISDWLNQGLTSASSISQTSIPAQDPETTDTETTRFLRFQFGYSDTALLPLLDVKEVLKISPNEIVPVPNMPPCIWGIYNCRGEMLWLVDLVTQLNLQPVSTSQSNLALSHQEQTIDRSTLITAIAIQVDNKSLGIVTSKVFDIELYSPNDLQSPSTQLFSPQLLPFIQGHFPQSQAPVLNARALLQDPQFQVHSHSYL